MSKNPKPANKLTAFWAGLKQLMTSVELATLTLDDDTTVEVDDTTGEVFSLDADGNRGEALADGTYKLKDGTELVVKDGKQVEAAAAATDDTTVTAAAAAAPAAAGAKLADAATAAPATDATPAAVVMAEITLDTGEVIKHDPISKKLYDSAGQLLKSGKYKTADGVMFKVTTDQWWYETTETLSAQLAAVEKDQAAKDTTISDLKAKLAAAELKVAAKPAAAPLKLAGDKAAEKLAEQEAPKTRGQARFESLKALNGL